MNNLYENIPLDIPVEITEQILSADKLRIERIISRGHSSPENFWYDQDENEWVMVMKGSAKLLFEEDKDPVFLSAGNCVNIPAHVKHRVEWTEPGEDTIWLAVFYG